MSSRSSSRRVRQIVDCPLQKGRVISEHAYGAVALLAKQPAYTAGCVVMVNGEQKLLPRATVRRRLVLAADSAHVPLRGEKRVVFLDRHPVEGAQAASAPSSELPLGVVAEPLPCRSSLTFLAPGTIDSIACLGSPARQAELREHLRFPAPSAGLDLIARERFAPLLWARARNVTRLVVGSLAFFALGCASVLAASRCVEVVKRLYLTALCAGPSVCHPQILAEIHSGGQ